MKRVIALFIIIALYAVFVVSFTFANNKGLIEEGFNHLGITGESTESIDDVNTNIWDPMPPPPPPPPGG